jgi:hypothetical protein
MFKKNLVFMIIAIFTLSIGIGSVFAQEQKTAKSAIEKCGGNNAACADKCTCTDCKGDGKCEADCKCCCKDGMKCDKSKCICKDCATTGKCDPKCECCKECKTGKCCGEGKMNRGDKKEGCGMQKAGKEKMKGFGKTDCGGCSKK